MLCVSLFVSDRKWNIRVPEFQNSNFKSTSEMSYLSSCNPKQGLLSMWPLSLYAWCQHRGPHVTPFYTYRLQRQHVTADSEPCLRSPLQSLRPVAYSFFFVLLRVNCLALDWPSHTAEKKGQLLCFIDWSSTGRGICQSKCQEFFSTGMLLRFTFPLLSLCKSGGSLYVYENYIF